MKKFIFGAIFAKKLRRFLSAGIFRFVVELRELICGVVVEESSAGEACAVWSVSGHR